MSRRIDIELTSRREDGSWTWRAPGAREPRGSLDGGLVPSVAKVGDVLRAEADFELEGITVVSVQAPRAEEHNGGPQRIEVLGSGRDKVDGVSVTLVPGSRRQHDDGDRERRPRRTSVNAAQLAPARRDPPPVVVEAQVVTRDRTPLTVSAGRGRSAPVRAGARTPAARNVALPTVPRVLTVPRVPTVLEVLTVPEVPIAPGVLTVPAVPTSAPATTGLNGATGPAGPNRRLPTATPHWRR